MIDPKWYKKIWTLGILDMSWVEYTKEEVDFVIEALQLRGNERILDLACGFGRHSLELAHRGYSVVGVDITEEYIKEAQRLAKESQLEIDFICADLRGVLFNAEFDVVLNLADGAIGYLENEEENLRIFDLIASALKPGGKHLMETGSVAYARKYFPKSDWDAGSHSISLSFFEWDELNSRIICTSYVLRYGEVLTMPSGVASSIRVYTVEELCGVFEARNMKIDCTYGDYDTAISASEDALSLIVCSQKY